MIYFSCPEEEKVKLTYRNRFETSAEKYVKLKIRHISWQDDATYTYMITIQTIRTVNVVELKTGLYHQTFDDPSGNFACMYCKFKRVVLTRGNHFNTIIRRSFLLL